MSEQANVQYAPPTPRRDTKGEAAAETLVGGAAAGLLAGIGMALFTMLRSSFAGLGVWLPMKLVAAVYHQEMALVGDADMVLLGLGTHLAVAAAWGVLFALMAGVSLRPRTALLAGLAFGAGAFLIMTYLVLPSLNAVMFERVTLQARWFFADHLVFGLVLALAPSFARAWHARRHTRG